MIRTTPIFPVDADKIIASRPRWIFNAASANETRNLGHHFSAIVQDFMREAAAGSKLRIGLGGGRSYGKTTFATAIYEPIGDKTTVEINCNSRRQYTWHCGAHASLRTYDALVRWENSVLPSYANDNRADFRPVHVDLVEHWSSDQHDKEFDYIISFRCVSYSSQREITVAPTPEMAASPGFGRFVAACQPQLLKIEQF